MKSTWCVYFVPLLHKSAETQRVEVSVKHEQEKKSEQDDK